METIKVINGTRSPMIEQLDLDQHGKAVPTNADDKTWRVAFDLFKETVDDVTFASGGHRNDDAVNGCIALHVMGYDCYSWFENYCASQKDSKFYRDDLDKFMEHVERVAPYVETWGPSGNESAALGYSIG